MVFGPVIALTFGSRGTEGAFVAGTDGETGTGTGGVATTGVTGFSIALAAGVAAETDVGAFGFTGGTGGMYLGLSASTDTRGAIIGDFGAGGCFVWSSAGLAETRG